MNDEPHPSSKRERRNAAREHAAALRLAEQRRRRRRRAIAWGAGGVGVLVVAVVVVLAVTLTAAQGGADAAVGTGTGSTTGTGTLGPEGMAVESGTPLAADTTGSSGATRDGIACDAGEGAAEHIHTRLAVYVDGVLRPIPVGVGVVSPAVQDPGTPQAFAQATRCYYWLHVHAADGVIHVEAPTTGTYTLGQFFAVWGQPLSSSTVAGAKGEQTVYVNGKVVTGDPASIALGSRESVQIDVGEAVPYHPVDWSRSQL